MHHWNAPIMCVVEMEITKNLKGLVKLRKKATSEGQQKTGSNMHFSNVCD